MLGYKHVVMKSIIALFMYTPYIYYKEELSEDLCKYLKTED